MKYVLAQLMGTEQISEDVVRGWIESHALPTVSYHIKGVNLLT